MMGHCKDCPGQESLIEHMNSCDELSTLEDVSYLQWVSTDRAKLVTITESKVTSLTTFLAKWSNLLSIASLPKPKVRT